ncbi:MAG: pyridoxamine 5'-phosphate oxidase family protein [Pseudomonadota bacterium]
MAAGVAHGDDPFRRVALATMGENGPEARMVGLRAADRATGHIEVHSDLRTDKVRALRSDPRAALLFWDLTAEVQLRVSARLSVVVADPERWQKVPASSRGNYGTDPAPGTPLDDPTAYDRAPDPAHFAALGGPIDRFDLVSLAHTPHRRAQFDLASGQATWCAP